MADKRHAQLIRQLHCLNVQFAVAFYPGFQF